MHWQDIVFGAGSIVFIIALVPMLHASTKPPYSTSIPTGMVLATFAITFATLSLPFAATTDAVTAAQWLTLAVQRFYATRTR